MAEYVYEREYYNGIQWEPDKYVAVDDKYLASSSTKILLQIVNP